eukprot:Opistho-2@21496
MSEGKLIQFAVEKTFTCHRPALLPSLATRGEKSTIAMPKASPSTSSPIASAMDGTVSPVGGVAVTLYARDVSANEPAFALSVGRSFTAVTSTFSVPICDDAFESVTAVASLWMARYVRLDLPTKLAAGRKRTYDHTGTTGVCPLVALRVRHVPFLRTSHTPLPFVLTTARAGNSFAEYTKTSKAFWLSLAVSSLIVGSNPLRIVAKTSAGMFLRRVLPSGALRSRFSFVSTSSRSGKKVAESNALSASSMPRPSVDRRTPGFCASRRSSAMAGRVIVVGSMLGVSATLFTLTVMAMENWSMWSNAPPIATLCDWLYTPPSQPYARRVPVPKKFASGTTRRSVSGRARSTTALEMSTSPSAAQVDPLLTEYWNTDFFESMTIILNWLNAIAMPPFDALRCARATLRSPSRDTGRLVVSSSNAGRVNDVSRENTSTCAVQGVLAGMQAFLMSQRTVPSAHGATQGRLEEMHACKISQYDDPAVHVGGQNVPTTMHGFAVVAQALKPTLHTLLHG